VLTHQPSKSREHPVSAFDDLSEAKDFTGRQKWKSRCSQINRGYVDSRGLFSIFRFYLILVIELPSGEL
jgi:hypothetical protein